MGQAAKVASIALSTILFGGVGFYVQHKLLVSQKQTLLSDLEQEHARLTAALAHRRAQSSPSANRSQ